MRYIERSVKAPAILTDEQARKHKYATAKFMARSQEQLSQQQVVRSSLNLGHASLREQLNTLFAKRCAFCEARVPTQPYRFRPVANALPHQASEQAHLYYCWLDVAWQNFYAICTSCLPQEAEYFPVYGKRAAIPDLPVFKRYAEMTTGLWPDYPLQEKPVLLDPCEDRDLHKHIGAQTDGRLIGLSERGVLSLEHFSLNAPERIQQRATAYRLYFEKLVDWMKAADNTDTGTIFDFAQLEFGGTWYLLLRRLAASIGAKRGAKPILSASRIDRVFRQLHEGNAGPRTLQQCWQQVVLEDLMEFSGTRPQLSRQSDASLSSVRIENFKSLEHLEISLPTPRPTLPNEPAPRTPALLILGENAAGKSSILEAIALGLSTDAAVKALGLTARNFILNTHYLGAQTPSEITQAVVEIRLSDQSRRVRSIAPTSINPAKGSQEHIPVFAYGAFRQYQYKGRSNIATQTFVNNLFDGSVLPNPEKWLLGLKPDRFAMVIRALSHILSIDGNFEVVRRDPQSQQCFVVTAFRSDGSVLSQSSLNVASSGFRSVLAMACDIMRGIMDRKVYPHFDNLESARGVVLIDEVEAHLHPRWKMQIMRGLRRALPNVTFIATTHDPLCLRGMDDGETVVLRRVRVNDGTTDSGLPMRIELLTELPSASELRLEQLLTSDLFQLHSTDDPAMDKQLAKIADLLRKPAPNEAEQLSIEQFRHDIVSALPIGTSEVHRIVQEAVAEYLKTRRHQPAGERKAAREAVKQHIVDALRSVL